VPSPPTARELDAFRLEADRFTAELLEEYYLHFAGLKEAFDLSPIYERHSGLTTLERAQSLGAAFRSDAGEADISAAGRLRRASAAVDGDAGVRELWRFACEGFLSNLTKEHAERVARLEAELVVEFEGEQIPFRMLHPRIANEPDRDVRKRLDDLRNDLTDEHLNPIYVEALEVERGAVTQLDAPTYLDLYRRFGWKLDELGQQCRSLLDSTERLYEDALDGLFRSRLGIPLAEAESWDVPRLFRAPQWDSAFPSDKMLPALEGTLRELGIDLRAQPNVELDVEQREKKSPRAFCAPIEVPSRVVLVIQPIGGPDDWQALFHEAGHVEHFAHASPDLRVEERRFGDNAVTEGWAMLFQHLTDEPAWLTRRLDFPRPREYAAEGAAGLLFFVRRYCAKLLYELELHAGAEPDTARVRYVELLGDALKIEPPGSRYLSDVDASFYVTSYLRSWAFEAQIRDHLRTQFGSEWFARREAGDLLRELWALGQKPTADELLRDVTGSGIEMEAVADRVREGLAV
jgi:hypothetical protein